MIVFLIGLSFLPATTRTGSGNDRNEHDLPPGVHILAAFAVKEARWAAAHLAYIAYLNMDIMASIAASRMPPVSSSI